VSSGSVHADVRLYARTLGAGACSTANRIGLACLRSCSKKAMKRGIGLRICVFGPDFPPSLVYDKAAFGRMCEARRAVRRDVGLLAAKMLYPRHSEHERLALVRGLDGTGRAGLYVPVCVGPGTDAEARRAVRTRKTVAERLQAHGYRTRMIDDRGDAILFEPAEGKEITYS